MNIFHNKFLEEKFRNKFLEEKKPDYSKIPLPYVFHMHNHLILLMHYYRQVLIIYILLHQYSNIHHYNLSIHDISIIKTDPHELFLFILDTENQWLIHPCHGYHVSIYPFFMFDCFYKNKKNRLIISEPQLYPSMIHLLKMILPSDHKLNTFISKYCEKKIKIMFEHPLYLYLYPMIDIENKTISTADPIDIIKTEINKMFGLFYKEFKIIEDYFPNQKNTLISLLQDWINIFYSYKKDFWKDDTTTIALLKKILYQYLIDHHYNIPLKKIDLKKMIISLYLWTQWFEKLLHSSSNTFFGSSEKNNLFILLNCIDLFFHPDTLYNDNITTIKVFDFMNQKEYNVDCSSVLYHQLLKVHPLLRANYIYHHIIHSI